MALHVFEFFLCALTIVICGTYLAKYGDIIAEKFGLGRAWIGLILVASITSLPELVNGISSVTAAKTPDIAAGNIMGSCVFNLSTIALMDLLHGPRPIFSRADQGHILSAGFSLILIGIAATSIMAGDLIPSFLNVGLYTPVIAVVYFIGIRSVFLFEKRRLSEVTTEVAEEQYPDVSLKQASVLYSINAVIIVAAAIALPFLGARIASETGLGETFVGTFFIGVTTALPELVVSIAALRIGAADMAIANLFGSNMFNILILAIDDIFFLDGPLLSMVSVDHAVTALMSIMMTGMAVVALTYRLRKKTFLRVGWDGLALLSAYVLSVILLYRMR